MEGESWYQFNEDDDCEDCRVGAYQNKDVTAEIEESLGSA